MTQDIENFVDEYGSKFYPTVGYNRYQEEADWLRTTLTKVAEEARKKERERLIEILERTKDRIDCDKPTCDTCNAAIARNAGLDSAIRRVKEK